MFRLVERAARLGDEKIKGKKLLGDIDVHGRIILKLVVNK
jgi:hypothetical protein